MVKVKPPLRKTGNCNFCSKMVIDILHGYDNVNKTNKTIICYNVRVQN
jgi:hypothetical protein